MPDVVYYVACSLDGYIATEAGGVDWLDRYQGSGEDYGFVELYESVDALVMGSYTYEFALNHGPWRSPDKVSWVFTTRDLEVMHPSITMTSADPGQLMKTLDERGIKRVWLMGGGKLAGSFRERGLISQYMVGIIPTVLGRGIPLIRPTDGQDDLRLVDSKVHPSGVVQLNYECVGD